MCWGGKFWECVSRRWFVCRSGSGFSRFAGFCREPGGSCSRWAVEGFGGKRREIAVIMGFCGDMVG